ncbi:hypothetical protein [Terrabacter sp. Root181]|uniref:hypothetical protein n=1 Tax=Terrabacter sp. Root181 TaxID=1736484 RepID=UPI0006FB501D|nr:hypothetical protein [Terrabacter sp. Root181]KRB42995.1 hypothetical protein ASD90_21645 [Terrabacter sp. Root181]
MFATTKDSLNAMVDRAEKVAAGHRPVKKDRFVKIEGATKGVVWERRARQLAGLKCDVTDIDPQKVSVSGG